MRFFDELKQPAPRREEPVLTPEEAAEAEVLRRLADPEVQRVAAEMARTIRSACLEARDRGERRIYGLVTGYRDSRSDFDGYDLPVSYFARFTPWEGGRPVRERRDTCDPTGAKPGRSSRRCSGCWPPPSGRTASRRGASPPLTSGCSTSSRPPGGAGSRTGTSPAG